MICEIYCMDIIKFLRLIKKKYSKKAIIIFADPPYNINKAIWDKKANYLRWCHLWIALSLELIRDNGSFYIFHNQFRAMRDIDLWIEKNTHLKFNQLITWNKFFESCANYEYLTTHLQIKGLNKYQKMAEYILFYTVDNSYKLKQKREELGISQLVISEEIRSKNNNLTGWYSNIEKGKNYPTKETIKPITKYLGFQYDDLVPFFKSSWSKKYKMNSVWNYDIPQKLNHVTPKPISLIKNILEHSSTKGDLVINLFSGSGNIEVACIESGRSVIGCDYNPDYVNFANSRLNILKHIRSCV